MHAPRGNQGWSTKPRDAHRRTGRPATGQRPQHQVRAWSEEWELVRRFVQHVRRDEVAARVALDELDRKQREVEIMDELMKDYFATMEQDAEMRYADDHDEDAPEVAGIDDRARADGEKFLQAFHVAFPESKTEGGSLYVARVYDDVDLPEAERKWLSKDKWLTDATAEIAEGVDGKFWIFFE